MPTLIPVTRNLTVQPIVDITDKDFARWYELGCWWAMYGDTIVTLTDPAFAKGYHAGRTYCFSVATAQERRLSDKLLFGYLNGWALDYRLWREAAAVLRYVLGCRIGHLSSALLPQIERVNVV